MFENFNRLLKKMDKPYTLETSINANGQPSAIARANVGIGNKEFPCDTTINIEPSQIPGSDKVIFTTFIQPGVGGANIEPFDKVVEVLNYMYPGKFVHDVSDGSQDILYTTSERLKGLNRQIFAENLNHHAQVVGQVAPELEHLVHKLGLETKSSQTPAETFAQNWDTLFRDTSSYVSSGNNVVYLPTGKRKE